MQRLGLEVFKKTQVATGPESLVKKIEALGMPPPSGGVTGATGRTVSHAQRPLIDEKKLGLWEQSPARLLLIKHVRESPNQFGSPLVNPSPMMPLRGRKELQVLQPTWRLCFEDLAPRPKSLGSGKQEPAPTNDDSPNRTRFVQSSADYYFHRGSTSNTTPVCLVSAVSTSA